MKYTVYQIFLAVLLVTTGSMNTVTTKWADKIDAESSDGKVRPFHHPFSQALTMFIGESMCLLVFKLLVYWLRRRGRQQAENAPTERERTPLAPELDQQNTLTAGNREFSVWIFFVPAMCDMVATSLMYIGLNLTYASSFQMLRGAVIAFVAILSIILLHHTISKTEWLGITVIMLGLVVVGVSDFQTGDTADTPVSHVIWGDILIIIAQVVAALQMVAEEYYVMGEDVAPLQAVGWEGVFGVLVLSILHIPMYYIQVPPPFSQNPRGVIEDLPDAFVQIGNNLLLIAPLIGTVISIAFFNFAGISLTKEMSAATRTVLDSVRTVLIWLITLALGWQAFSPIQILGFALLVLGMLIYNDIFVNNAARRLYKRALSRCTAEINARPQSIDSTSL